MNKPSIYRPMCKQVIEQVLSTLPEDATVEQIRKALYGDLPYRDGRSHGYRVWLNEVGKVIGLRLFLERQKAVTL